MWVSPTVPIWRLVTGVALRPLIQVSAAECADMPGLLAMAAVLPFWSSQRESVAIQGELKGINASVVGVLAAALYRPLWTTAIHTTTDFWFALWHSCYSRFGKFRRGSS
jgi:hypothetical protein